jgi:hypothetical protein
MCYSDHFLRRLWDWDTMWLWCWMFANCLQMRAPRSDLAAWCCWHAAIDAHFALGSP